jgi:hypothetical protein
MVQEYQRRRFFRNAPNRLLQRYFAARNVLSEVDFGALTETQVEPIYEAWLKLSDDARKEMEQDFQDIDELATEGGSKAILDEARWHGEDLASSSRRSRVSMNTLSGPSLNVRNTGQARSPFTTRTRCPCPIGVSARTCPASPPAWMPSASASSNKTSAITSTKCRPVARTAKWTATIATICAGKRGMGGQGI